MRTEATEKSGPCSRGGLRCRLIAAAKELLDFAIQIRQGTGGHRPARIDDDIPRCSQFREPGSHDFANPPLETVAENGLADSPRRGESKPWTGTVAGQTESRKERPAVTETVVVNFAEFAGS